MAVNKNIVKEIKDYRRILEASGLHIVDLYLYGSHATNTATEDSDIDVAIISDTFTGNRFADSMRIVWLSNKIDLRIEPTTFCPQDFIDEDPLVDQIKKYGLKIK